MSINPYSLPFGDYNERNMEVEIKSRVSPNDELEAWLTQVEYYSKLGFEGQCTLKDLAENPPSFTNAPPEAFEVLNKIKNVVVSKKYDPTLSPNSKSALTSLFRQLPSLENSPSVRKRLNFDNVMDVEF